jgi:hypothetical protein
MKWLGQKLQALQLPVVQRRVELQQEQLRQPEAPPLLVLQLELQLPEVQLELGESELLEGQQVLQRLALQVQLNPYQSR